ncbi:GAL4-like transcription factor-like protein [Dothidotthia symphoricarpi CBS 119687]|uniref:GAL4-like transcription factor-like protein n=1 Tax=Dothidotthia symphoricarpi CBS 119687 TaxID=1392245 RepID=A0A6A6A2X5_9PLEO|nr:GAL4-like transcription factor-like protein [Dothidotthia symphoricarpi CBS 119687]KAF2126160.1 GAL4-like transcription factor-like protein [Dothidotthia symphoricarpi CBS 119687]
MQNRTKVRRRVLACARCRRRKLSCDGKVPACTRCVDARVQCVGFDSSTQQEVPRSIADFLEAHIATLAGRPEGSTSTFSSPSNSGDSDAHYSIQWGTEKCAFTDSLVNRVMEDITPPFLGVTKAQPLLQCVVKGTQLPSKKGPVVSTDLDENHPRSIINPQPSKSHFHELIPDEVGANILFQNYLDRVITQYPIYHRNDVTTAFNSIYHRKASNLDQDTVRNRYIVCIMMAISLSTAARSNLQKANETAYQLVRHAMQWIPEVATNDIAGLQAILFLTQYIFLNPRMADLWLLTGLISQAVIDLGLHQELPNHSTISAYHRDMRRRLFWCAFEMEVGVCSIFLRPTSLPIRHIEVAFPVEIDDTAITQSVMELTGRVSKFTQRIICRFRLIEAEVISVLWHGDPIPSGSTSIEQWMQRCIADISLWQQEIYAAANMNRDPGLVARWKEMTLYSDISVPYILVTLYRPSRRIPDPNTCQMMIALVNAVKVADGYFQQSEAEAGRIKYVFHPCHHVFNCALVFLQGLQRCKQEVSQAYSWEDIEEWMHVFGKCFSRIAERWTAAQRCLEEYERLLSPIKNEYLDFLEHNASLLPLSSQAPATSRGPHRYSAPGPSSATPPAPPSAPAKIDEAFNLWSAFNPSTTPSATKSPSVLPYNTPPRDWNAEFSLRYGTESIPGL